MEPCFQAHEMSATAADKVSTDVSNAIPLPDDSH